MALTTAMTPNFNLPPGVETSFADRLRKQDWDVRPVGIDVAARIVRAYHYAKGTANTATYIHGLFRTGEAWDENCQGVAWWMPPTKSAGVNTYPQNPQGVLALSRLVIIPGVPKNACTFLLARSIKMIDHKRWPCLLTYADTMTGHTGGIYKAAGWTYFGTTRPEPAYRLKGVLISRKAGPKTRSHAQMLQLGAVALGKFAKHKFVLLP